MAVHAGSHKEDGLRDGQRRVYTAQVVISALLLLGTVLASESREKLYAVALGCVLGLVHTFLSARSVQRASVALLQSKGLGMLPLYAGLVNKLVLVAGGIAVGGILLHGSLPFIVLGFVAMQAGFLFCRAAVDELKGS